MSAAVIMSDKLDMHEKALRKSLKTNTTSDVNAPGHILQHSLLQVLEFAMFSLVQETYTRSPLCLGLYFLTTFLSIL